MRGEPDDALPRGGWFVRWVDRPESPLRLKWFVIAGAVAGAMTAAAVWLYLPAFSVRKPDPIESAFFALLGAWGAFCVVSLVGIVAQALVRLSVYGPEWSVSRPVRCCGPAARRSRVGRGRGARCLCSRPPA